MPMFEDAHPGQDVFINVALNQIFYTTSLFCAVISLFVGLMSIANERNNGSLNILLSKPLFRVDLLIGKFCGVNSFLFVFIGFNILLSSLLIMIFFRAPLSTGEFLLRMGAYVTMLFLMCSLSTAISMFIGVIFKDLLQASVVAITFFFIDWYGYLTGYLGDLKYLSPRRLLITIFSGDGKASLLDSTTPFFNWISSSSPYILFILLEIILTIIFSCMVFSRSDDC